MIFSGPSLKHPLDNPVDENILLGTASGQN